MTVAPFPEEAYEALEALNGLIHPALAPDILSVLAKAHVLRPRPWPPIPYPDDAAHQARWTLQRAFDQAMRKTSDRNEGLLAAADALIAEGWTPPPAADTEERADRLRAALGRGGIFYGGWLHDLRAVLGITPLPRERVEPKSTT